MTADSRSIARLNVRTNVVADLNIKADEINFETVAHRGGGALSPRRPSASSRSRSCCFPVMQLIARRSECEGLAGINTKRCSTFRRVLLSNYRSFV